MERILEGSTKRESGSVRTDPGASVGLRLILLAVLGFGIVGMIVELLLLGHTEETQQWIPLLTLGLGLVAAIALAARPSPATVKTFRVVMVLFVVAAVAGLYFHYSGNAEFELEMYPSMRGMELFRESMTGATPSLAPGMLAQLGLLGLAITWKHPALRR
jgi:hypothetical protein